MIELNWVYDKYSTFQDYDRSRTEWRLRDRLDLDDFFELFLGLEDDLDLYFDRGLRRRLLELERLDRELSRRFVRDECDSCDPDRLRSFCLDRDRLSGDFDLDLRSLDLDFRHTLDLDWLLSSDRERRDFSDFFVFIFGVGEGDRDTRLLRDFFTLEFDADLFRRGLLRSLFFFGGGGCDDLERERLSSRAEPFPFSLRSNGAARTIDTDLDLDRGASLLFSRPLSL